MTDPRDNTSETLWGRKRSECLEKGICVRCGNPVTTITQSYPVYGLCMDCDTNLFAQMLLTKDLQTVITAVRNFSERMWIKGQTQNLQSNGVGGMVACDLITMSLSCNSREELLANIEAILRTEDDLLN